MNDLNEMVVDLENDNNIVQLDYDSKDVRKKVRKLFSGVELAYFIFFIVNLVFQYALVIVFNHIFHNEVPAYMNFVLLILSTYVLGCPVLYLCLKKYEVTEIPKYTLSLFQILKYIFICAGITGVGALIGTPVHEAVTKFVGADINDTSVLNKMLEDSSVFWRLICPTILAPIFEELIFRKFLIDRIVKYGEGLAILYSGLMFGMFHGNFSQFFYAWFLGMFFAYIYIRTGKIWYTMLLHFVVNFTSSIITFHFISKIDMDFYEKFVNNIALYLDTNSALYKDNVDKIYAILDYKNWAQFLMLAAVIGIFILLSIFRRFYLTRSGYDIPRKKIFGIAFMNVGFILFFLSCVFLFLLTYITPVLLKMVEQIN